jgi:hypothetical protein
VVADAAILAQVADVVVYVVRWGNWVIQVPRLSSLFIQCEELRTVQESCFRQSMLFCCQAALIDRVVDLTYRPPASDV